MLNGVFATHECFLHENPRDCRVVKQIHLGSFIAAFHHLDQADLTAPAVAMDCAELRPDHRVLETDSLFFPVPEAGRKGCVTRKQSSIARSRGNMIRVPDLAILWLLQEWETSAATEYDRMRVCCGYYGLTCGLGLKQRHVHSAAMSIVKEVVIAPPTSMPISCTDGRALSRSGWDMQSP